MKKLAVITVTFNCCRLIQATIDSVRSLNSDLVEHIVIDGGSVDGTLDIVGRAKSQLAYFVSEPDSGIYHAMNKGIRVATGEWILFLNAGDVFCEKFSISDINWDWPCNTEFVLFPFIIDGDIEIKKPKTNTLFGMPTSHQAMFISTPVAKKIEFNMNRKVAADYEFFVMRYHLNSECVHIEDLVLSKVLPGGYSKINEVIMKKEYEAIVFQNLGLANYVVLFLRNRPAIFKFIKKVLPGFVFNRLKVGFSSF